MKFNVTKKARVRRRSGVADSTETLNSEDDISTSLLGRVHNKKYTRKEYESNNGFLTTVWGPCIWTFLHTVSFNYPVNPTNKEKKDYYRFILNLRHILPCGKCRKNLVNNMKKFPLTMKEMESRETFSKYIFNLHEVVNKMLNKNSGLTYELVRDRFENFRAHCLKEQKNEKGCITPLYGVKSKCLINIVPQNVKSETLSIDKKCLLSRK